MSKKDYFQTMKDWFKGINIQEYKEQLQIRIFIEAFYLFTIAYLIIHIGIQLRIMDFFTNITGAIPENGLLNTALILLLITSITTTYKHLRAGLLPTLGSVFRSIALLLFYLIHFRYNSFFELNTFRTWHIPFLTYLDLIVASGLLFFANYKSFYKTLSVTDIKNFTEDLPDSSIEDEIGNDLYSQHIASYINSSSTEASFAISVIGEWGSGKTDFMKRLDGHLQKSPNNLCINFNPWRASSSEIIIEDFFNILIKNLKPFNKSIASKIKSYSNKIFQPAKDVHFRIIDTIVNEFIKEDTIQERYENINKTIKSTGKRIVIYIDDLDRLNGREVFEVLRIIRNTANFANTFFVVAMDEKYITQALKKTNDIALEEEYLNKIFQLTLFLPKIKKSLFAASLRKYLCYNLMEESDRKKIDRVLGYLSYSSSIPRLGDKEMLKQESILESMLGNIRDVKRFSNSFKTSFNLLKNEVDVIDLALIELIKVKSIRTYEALSKRNFLSLTAEIDQEYQINDNRLNDFLGELSVSKEDKESIKDTLIALVSDAPIKTKRKFLKPNHFHLYFSYQLFDLISLTFFSELFEKDEAEIAENFKNLQNAGKAYELDYLLSDLVIESVDNLKKIIQALLVVSNSNNMFFYQARGMLAQAKQNDKLFPNEGDFKAFATEFFENESIDFLKRSQIIKEFIRDIYTRGVVDFEFTREELVRLNLDLLVKQLDNKSKFELDIYTLFLQNEIGRTDADEIILNPKAGQRMKDFILRTGIDHYLKFLLRSYMYPNNGYFVFEPFWKTIFNESKDFYKGIDSINTKDSDMLFLKSLVLKNRDNLEKTGQSGFYLEGEEQEKLLNYLKRNKQYSDD